METLWIFCNMGIFFAYIVICATIAPHLAFSFRARMVGSIFFATCGLTHLTMAIHQMETVDSIHPHDAALHVIQAVACWTFVTWAYQELHPKR